MLYFNKIIIRLVCFLFLLYHFKSEYMTNDRKWYKITVRTITVTFTINQVVGSKIDFSRFKLFLRCAMWIFRLTITTVLISKTEFIRKDLKSWFLRSMSEIQMKKKIRNIYSELSWNLRKSCLFLFNYRHGGGEQGSHVH